VLSNISQVYPLIIHGICECYPIYLEVYPWFIPGLYTRYTNVFRLYHVHMISNVYVAGFRSRLRDTADLPPPIDQLPEDEDHGQPEPEDDEFHGGPDQAAKDSAIADFLKRLEGLERHQYTGLDQVLSRLPVPKKVDQAGLSVSAAMDAGMLPRMDEEESQRFTPTEVLLYQHAQDHR